MDGKENRIQVRRSAIDGAAKPEASSCADSTRETCRKLLFDESLFDSSSPQVSLHMRHTDSTSTPKEFKFDV